MAASCVSRDRRGGFVLLRTASGGSGRRGEGRTPWRRTMVGWGSRAGQLSLLHSCCDARSRWLRLPLRYVTFPHATCSLWCLAKLPVAQRLSGLLGPYGPSRPKRVQYLVLWPTSLSLSGQLLTPSHSMEAFNEWDGKLLPFLAEIADHLC